MQNNNEETHNKSETKRNPDEWTTGSEPISPDQKSYLQQVQDEPVKSSISNATAFNMIDAANKKKDPTNAEANKENKAPTDWVTGSEEMTEAQRSYLKSLADEAGEEVDETQSKATASKQIEELQRKKGKA